MNSNKPCLKSKGTVNNYCFSSAVWVCSGLHIACAISAKSVIKAVHSLKALAVIQRSVASVTA